LYIADPQNNRIQILDLNGNFIGTFGGANSGITADMLEIYNDKLFSISWRDSEIRVYSLDGQLESTIGGFCDFTSNARTGCVDPDGEGPLDLGDGQFNEITDFTISDDGTIYVLDGRRISVHDSQGNFIKNIGDISCEYEAPWGLRTIYPRAVLTKDNFVYIIDSSLGWTLQKYDTSDETCRVFINPPSQDAYDALWNISGFGISPGNHFFLWHGTSPVSIYDSSGNFINKFKVDSHQATVHIDFDSQNRMILFSSANTSDPPPWSKIHTIQIFE